MRYCLYILGLVAILFTSCESEIDIDVPVREPETIVEGYIDIGIPPVLLLTESSPFFSSVDLESLEDLFIHDATVIVSNNGISDTLIEVQADSVREFLRLAEDSLNLNIDLSLFEEFANLDLSTIPDFNASFYVSINPLLVGRPNNRYDLRIETEEGKVLTSTTTIPTPTPLDSIFLTPHPDPDNTTQFGLNGSFTDTPNQFNAIRYFTQQNFEPFFPPFFNSVFDDRTFINADGESFSFALEIGIPRNQEIEDFSDSQFLNRGDTARVRWAAIDDEHFAFWSSLEFDRTQVGNPFGRPTIISSNIEGGLGIWGGYASTFETIIVE